MDFGVLGELGVVADTGPITIGSPKSRTALALLVLRRGAVVQGTEIADALWGRTAPSNARKSTHVVMNRLRKALGPLGDVVRTRADGYLLDVPHDSTDVGRFTSWLDTAANARDKGSGDELAALDRALDQWRGDPLSDVPSDLLDTERTRLTEQRLTAIERQHDLLITAGRPADIALLQDLCERYPFREGIWFQLIRGLSESGRRSEALNAFDRLRVHLAAELGVEPGARLRELHSLVLDAEDPMGGAVRLGVLRAPPVVPRQVPHVAGFVGRDEEQERLDALVPGSARTGTSDTAVVVISGQPGVGKTALTAWWARRTADRFADGQLWLDLRGSRPGAVMSADEALQHLLVSLGEQPSETPGTAEERAARYQTLTDGRRLLVVLDDAANSEQVRPLLPGSPGSMVLVTSRYRLDGLVAREAATGIGLDVLPATDARRLLMRRLGTAPSGDEATLLDEIAGHCGRLPLALAIVAARAARRRQVDLGSVVTELRSGRPGLDQFTVGEDTSNLRTVYSWSYESLSVPAARLFRLLGVHPTSDLSIEAAASLAGLPIEHASRRVSELESAHLVAVLDGGRIELHDLLHAYAGELNAGLDNRQAVRRLLDHYARTARTSVERLGVRPATLAGASDGPRDVRGVTVPPIGSGPEAQRWFAAEHANLVAVVRQAGDLRHDAECVRIGVLATELQEWNGQWGEVTRTQAVVLAAALRGGMRDVAARAEFHLGKAAYRQGDRRRAYAHFLRAEVRNRELGHSAGSAEVHLGLGAVAESQERWDEALEHDRQALEHVRTMGDRMGETRALNAIGWDLAHLGELDTAVVWCEEALRLAERIDDQRAAAASWDSLGYCRAQAGDRRGALRAYQRAVGIRNGIGYRNGIAKGYRAMGDLHAELGDKNAAERAWRASLQLLDRSAPLAADAERERLVQVYGVTGL
ncbi:DNA-binding SARP family transcriptional activator [Promicromonospora sp. AC04]|uniref:AfsR/SARP family transcriptional regulator n=1 Tax=Promicromonospora sp. AC04 TaxID=2135723 RepID=UPI000D3A123A|nr:BTAD domain-containing putative transcriptional regulator [Promicromonospora sp. AC04]PUB31931.1 DNA-binding SARP family transcriptional activator [Promicromonospora sp. AC04]